MSNEDTAVKQAEMVSMLLEGFLYGTSLPMFGATIWALRSQRSVHQVNFKMLTVACLLFLLSTMHFLIHVIGIMDGLEYFRPTNTGGPRGYFSAVPQWTLVSKSYLYSAQTLIGDGVVLYRCYVVWQSKSIMMLPVLLWCAVLATGIGSPFAQSRLTQSNFSSVTFERWNVAFWASTLATNLLTTFLLAFRIWYVSRKATRLHDSQKSRLRPILRMIIDAGAIYSVTLLVALVCFIWRFDIQYAIPDMITPIISITFYMVIIRVGMANRVKQPNSLSLGYTCASNDQDRRSRMQVHITTFTESRIENNQHSATSPSLAGSENKHPSEIKFSEAGENV